MVFLMLLEYLAAAGMLYLFITQIAEPFWKQRPLFPMFRKPEVPSLDPLAEVLAEEREIRERRKQREEQEQR
jgi:hypothetical protein